MAEHGSRDFWRTRCEQLIASGMKVHEWCALNHVHASSMYEWLKRFHREDPSMFDGIGLPEGMEGYGHGWYEAVRKAYADAHAIVPQRLSAAPFAVVATTADPLAKTATEGDRFVNTAPSENRVACEWPLPKESPAQSMTPDASGQQ